MTLLESLIEQLDGGGKSNYMEDLNNSSYQLKLIGLSWFKLIVEHYIQQWENIHSLQINVKYSPK